MEPPFHLAKFFDLPFSKRLVRETNVSLSLCYPGYGGKSIEKNWEKELLFEKKTAIFVLISAFLGEAKAGINQNRLGLWI